MSLEINKYHARKVWGITMAQSSKNDFCISLSDLANFLNQTPEQIKTQFRELIGLPIRSTWLLPTQVRQILLSANFQYPNKTISFQMLKGGVAKTSSALNIGLRAAQFGARVLFIDLDQQANLSFALGVEDENLPVWLNIVEKNKTVDECVISIEPQVDLIPSGLDN